MSTNKPTGRIEYVVVYDVQRVLYNGNLVSICKHGPETVGGFSTFELAVTARAQMYDYFLQCGQPCSLSELVITPMLVSLPVYESEKSGTEGINVWPKVEGVGKN
jgi:hypothetical protein